MLKKKSKNCKIRKKSENFETLYKKSGKIRIIFWIPYFYGKICMVGNPDAVVESLSIVVICYNFLLFLFSRDCVFPNWTGRRMLLATYLATDSLQLGASCKRAFRAFNGRTNWWHSWPVYQWTEILSRSSSFVHRRFFSCTV